MTNDATFDAGLIGPGTDRAPTGGAAATGVRSSRRRLVARTALWLAAACSAGLAIVLAWLALFVPVEKSARPLVQPRIVMLTRQGQPFARSGPLMDRPVAVSVLPDHVAQAFYAIEDRRFQSHWGIDPVGIGRALVSNLTGGPRQGGSTITQQLAKNVYLRDARGGFEEGLWRKAKEAAIALWLETWLTKDQILERYLSNVMFGDQVYGLRAASLHYFYRQPERLTLAQAVMLAGLVQAPNRFQPTRNLGRAQRRAAMVARAMAAAGYISAAEAAALAPATLDVRNPGLAPSGRTGSYFGDWARGELRSRAISGYAEQRIVTTLDGDLQPLADRVMGTVPPGIGGALVAMRPNGEVVAMVGGQDYGGVEYNLATGDGRQMGSTFKLFVYLAALRSGMTPDTPVSDAAFETGSYRPRNSDGRYEGAIPLSDAFARSSNVAAVRLYQRIGHEPVLAAARDLGLSAVLEPAPSLALGTANASLLELTAAYAAIADGRYPVRPTALPATQGNWISQWWDDRRAIDAASLDGMRSMMRAVVERGTGRSAALPVAAFGKTGTTQNNRDAWFVGYAGDLVVGIWLGDDAGQASAWMSGGTGPARLWHSFMTAALAAGKLSAAPALAQPGPLDSDAIAAAVPMGVAGSVAGTVPRPAVMPNDGIAADGGAIGDLGSAVSGERGVDVGTERAGGVDPASADRPIRQADMAGGGRTDRAGGVERPGSGAAAWTAGAGQGSREPDRPRRATGVASAVSAGGTGRRPASRPAQSAASSMQQPARRRLADGSVLETQLVE